MKRVPEKMSLMVQVVMAGFAGKIRIGRKGEASSIPSWTHSVRVMLILQSYGYDPETFLGGGAHDLKEDTCFTRDYISNVFGERVAFLMCSCSLNPRLGDTCEGENELYARVIRLAEVGDYDPLRIKIADSFDNNRNIHELNAEWAPDSLERGFLWLKAAERFIPEDAMVEDFRVMLNREKGLMP